MRAKHQEYKRIGRLYKRAKAIAERENPYFITFTYSDRWIEKASIEKARKWLKEYATHYFANNDRGAENDRLHHHAFCNLKNDQIDLPKSWKYGTINVKKYRGNGIKGISKYIDKISRHAVKHGTSKLIRSKEI